LAYSRRFAEGILPLNDAVAADTAATAPPKHDYSVRAARGADIGLIHGQLMAVIDESPYYNAEFKAYEKSRLTPGLLVRLQSHDPWHVMALLCDGEVGGALISGPEYGAVFRYWSWIFPDFRRTHLGMHGMRAFDAQFDNGRFHKAFTFVRPENTVALALLRRYGYTETCVLKNHIFGQDYALLERPYTKVVEGYDHGVGPGRLGRIAHAVSGLVGR
jgi:ribosomal protein S18 acetylase RimI-like enzyme